MNGKLVMVVDNNAKFRRALTGLLKSQGYQVIQARNGADALSKAEQKIPDLIISDLEMPVMSGHTLLRHFKTREKLATIPFIVHSDFYVESNEVELAWSIGADALITKPSEPAPLLSLVQKLLDETREKPAEYFRNPVFDAEALLQKSNEGLVLKLKNKVTELSLAVQNLERSEARLNFLLSNMPVCVLLVNKEASIADVNRTGLRLFKARSEDQLVGKPLLDIIPEEYQAALVSLLKNVFDGAEDLHRCEIKDLSGARRWAEIIATPISTHGGPVDGTLIVVRDLTEPGRLHS